MRFNPTEKAKGLLRDWHQMCQDDESNAQPAWNKVRPPPWPIFLVSYALLERMRLGHVSAGVVRETTSVVLGRLLSLLALARTEALACMTVSTRGEHLTLRQWCQAHLDRT